MYIISGMIAGSEAIVVSLFKGHKSSIVKLIAIALDTTCHCWVAALAEMPWVSSPENSKASLFTSCFVDNRKKIFLVIR